MNNVAIRVEGLGKQYRVGTKRANGLLSEAIMNNLRKPFFGLGEMFGGKTRDSMWAIRDLNFEIQRNDIVGVIGRNGSGKSTLLRILSGITEPTEGRAELWGKTASLLEVGTGFHPELTGRENVYLNGAILGMKKSEIDSKFNEIMAFSEIARFMDSPVKHYSSGMAVRLAFAVAAHLEPEILMIDEVLAVGDLKFQRKCLDKMHDVVKHGKTILFVTHQMNAVRRLCTKCIWLESGTLKMFGQTAAVVAAYESASLNRSTNFLEGAQDARHSQFVSWSICGNAEENAHTLEKRGEFTLKFLLQVHRPLDFAIHGLALWNASDDLMWAFEAHDLHFNVGVQELLYTLPDLPLSPGSYRWHARLYEGGQLLDEWFAVPEMIVATEPVSQPNDTWAGILNISCDFKTQQHT